MVRFLMDAHVPSAITGGLATRGVDVLTVQQDRTEDNDDRVLLMRATLLNRVLVSMDRDFERLVAEAQAQRTQISGVIGFSRKLSYRQCIDDLELIAKCTEPREWENQFFKLPL